jgi:hypothetical protein
VLAVWQTRLSVFLYLALGQRLSFLLAWELIEREVFLFLKAHFGKELQQIAGGQLAGRLRTG